MTGRARGLDGEVLGESDEPVGRRTSDPVGGPLGGAGEADSWPVTTGPGVADADASGSAP